MEKIFKVLFGLMTISILTSALISILRFMNVSDDKYLIYLLWFNFLVVLYLILPSEISFDKL